MATFEYFINLDERGEFYADVRNAATGETVWEIKSEDDGTIALIEDGFMKHSKDLGGLTDLLFRNGIMKDGDKLDFGQ